MTNLPRVISDITFQFEQFDNKVNPYSKLNKSYEGYNESKNNYSVLTIRSATDTSYFYNYIYNFTYNSSNYPTNKVTQLQSNSGTESTTEVIEYY
jgi:hypothetical protein